MWKNIVEQGGPQITIWRMYIACWIPKAIDIHLQYVTHGFSTATLVRERTSVLRTLAVLLASTGKHQLPFFPPHKKYFLFLLKTAPKNHATS
jgi:hypothetical protein